MGGELLPPENKPNGTPLPSKGRGRGGVCNLVHRERHKVTYYRGICPSVWSRHPWVRQMLMVSIRWHNESLTHPMASQIATPFCLIARAWGWVSSLRGSVPTGLPSRDDGHSPSLAVTLNQGGSFVLFVYMSGQCVFVLRSLLQDDRS